MHTHIVDPNTRTTATSMVNRDIPHTHHFEKGAQFTEPFFLNAGTGDQEAHFHEIWWPVDDDDLPEMLTTSTEYAGHPPGWVPK